MQPFGITFALSVPHMLAASREVLPLHQNPGAGRRRDRPSVGQWAAPNNPDSPHGTTFYPVAGIP